MLEVNLSLREILTNKYLYLARLFIADARLAFADEVHGVQDSLQELL